MVDAPSGPETAPAKKAGWSEAKVSLLIIACLVVGGLIWHDADKPGAPRAHYKDVSSTDYPTNWPLTVDGGTLWCESDGELFITVLNAGDSYALNGTARDNRFNKPIDLIWADDPHTPGLKMGLAPLIADAQKLC